MLIQLLQQIFNGLLTGSIYAIVALGITMTFGLLNILNFAHGEMLMLGGYLAMVMVNNLGLSFFLAVPLAMVLVAGLGLLVERFTFRHVRGLPVNGLIISIGLIAVFQNVAAAIWGADYLLIKPTFTDNVEVWGIPFALQRLFATVVVLALVVSCYVLLQRSKTGKAIRAVAQESEAAALMGIPIDRVVAISFALGAALAAAAGAFVGSIFFLTPHVGTNFVMKGFVVIILGGLGSIPGAILGSVILGLAESLGAGFLSSEFQAAYGFAIMILVLMFRPWGLFGRPERA